MIIDAHAHIIPRSFPDATGFPRMIATERDDVRRLMFGRTDFLASAVFYTVDDRIAAMDAAGVDEEVLSPMPPLLNFSLGAAQGRDLFRYVNEMMSDVVVLGQGRIHGLGVVPLQDPDLASAELARVAALGLRGVEVSSHVNGVPIGDARFVDFFREIARLGMSVFVHAMPRLDEVGLAEDLRASVGVGIEGARGAASLILGPVGAVCAHSRVTLSHAGGGLPAMLPRADYFWAHADPSTRSAEPPSVRARRFVYDSMAFDPRTLRYVIDYLGADRIVLGTDFPAMERPERLDELLTAVDASARERDLIGAANARTFLGQAARIPGSMR
ncbi:amidohydrolase family protein [Microbacterium sediminicola]|uniref:Amidohydrolase family protein n=1 Tax=Microbacterium sediminicola TaxID=415210 RepID=A0ABN2I081_9MICO